MMPRILRKHKQQGATLLIGMILLAVIMLMAMAAYMLSSSSLKSVGNMQFRNEVVAASNKAIEQVISSPFTDYPKAETINVDLDNDGKTDYVVQISKPECVQATIALATPPSSLALGAGFSAESTWNTVWDIKATVADSASGASVEVHSGVRVLLSDSKKKIVCT